MEHLIDAQFLAAHPDFAAIYTPETEDIKDALRRAYKAAEASTWDAILGYLSTSRANPPSPDEILDRIKDMVFHRSEGGVGRPMGEIDAVKYCLRKVQTSSLDDKCEIKGLMKRYKAQVGGTSSEEPTAGPEGYSSERRYFIALLLLAGDQGGASSNPETRASSMINFRGIRTRYREPLRLAAKATKVAAQQAEKAAKAAARAAARAHNVSPSLGRGRSQRQNQLQQSAVSNVSENNQPMLNADVGSLAIQPASLEVTTPVVVAQVPCLVPDSDMVMGMNELSAEDSLVQGYNLSYGLDNIPQFEWEFDSDVNGFPSGANFDEALPDDFTFPDEDIELLRNTAASSEEWA